MSMKKRMRKRGLSPFFGTVPFLLFFIFCFTSFVKAEQGLVGWWKFDESKGDVLHDSSGIGNDGKIYGAKWIKKDGVSCLLFDGKDDYVDCDNDVSHAPSGSVTVSIWVNIPQALEKIQYVISRHDWNIGIDTSLIPFFESWDANGIERVNINANKVIPVDKWVHITAVYSIGNKIMEFYINGEITNSQGRTDGAIDGFHHWSLMFGREVLEPRNFRGIIGETKIYNRALSKDEIKKN